MGLSALAASANVARPVRCTCNVAAVERMMKNATPFDIAMLAHVSMLIRRSCPPACFGASNRASCAGSERISSTSCDACQKNR
jgi:hypothetical protein